MSVFLPNWHTFGRFLIYLQNLPHCMLTTTDNNLALHAHAVASEVVHGGWSKWTSWSRCSKTCGQGIQLRSRSCTDPTPSQAGRSCRGRGRDMRRCKITDCPKCKSFHAITKLVCDSNTFHAFLLLFDFLNSSVFGNLFPQYTPCSVEIPNEYLL